MSEDEHPPFCPKTEERFGDRGYYEQYGPYVVWFGRVRSSLKSCYPDERGFIARYQACAWEDRGDRWSRLWGRKPRGPRGDGFSLELRRCRENARAWRAWEAK
jgi:hypothetical protein